MTTPALFLAISFLPFFEARNTVANYILTPPGEGAQEVSTQKPDLTIKAKCPSCEGKGTMVVVEPDYGQEKGRLTITNKKRTITCPFCNGRRKVTFYADCRELELQVVADREKFESDHLAKGDIPVGFAFVPRETYEALEETGPADGKEARDKMRELKKLRKEKLKLVETTYGEPCKNCHWMGIVHCKNCDGSGRIDCNNDGCKDGWIVEKTSIKSSKSTSGRNTSSSYGFRNSSPRSVTRISENISVLKCPDCSGTGKLTCPKCTGLRAIPCEKCKGYGTKAKGR